MRILLTEDDAVLAAVVGEFLRDEGHDVTRVADIGVARQLIAAGAWDLCLVDPAGTSYEMLRAEDIATFRELAAYSPVVVTTGRDWAKSAYSDDLGVRSVLLKPYDLLMLKSLNRHPA
jgi:DNA-binding response OmpR family regulator